jgi:CheY-like chemotaxis protein
LNIANLNFVVVEDNECQRELLVGVIKAMGAKNVWWASDGPKALDVLNKAGTSVDVIITDLAMPVIDGLGFDAVSR